MRAIGAALTARGVAPERVATEAFGAVAVHASGIVKAGDRAPHAPDGPPGTGPTVTFVAQRPRRRRGTTAIASLLDLAEACDVPVGFGCRNGVCHNCESGVLSGDGRLRHRPARAAARRAGSSSAARRPASELTLDL